jgi:hypothetical protein
MGLWALLVSVAVTLFLWNVLWDTPKFFLGLIQVPGWLFWAIALGLLSWFIGDSEDQI